MTVLGPFGRKDESPVRRTVAAIALATVNLAIKIGSNFLLIPLALRYLGREEYAVWIILQSISVYLTQSERGIGQTVVNFGNAAYVRGDFDELNRILASIFGLFWAIVIPVWIVSTGLLATMPVERWFLRDVSESGALPAPSKVPCAISCTFS
jgi:O-antigen/teichoic acid export membrane protein